MAHQDHCWRGLTQRHNLPQLALRTGEFFGASAFDGNHERAFALSIVLYFGVAGFVGGYLFTRIYVTGAFVRADVENDRAALGRRLTGRCAAGERHGRCASIELVPDRNELLNRARA